MTDMEKVLKRNAEANGTIISQKTLDFCCHSIFLVATTYQMPKTNFAYPGYNGHQIEKSYCVTVIIDGVTRYERWGKDKTEMNKIYADLKIHCEG